MFDSNNPKCLEGLDDNVVALIGNAHVTSDIDLSAKELAAYIKAAKEDAVRCCEKHGILKNIKIFSMPDNNIGIDYDFVPPKFERIRRITGYLVGTIDRWNDAKRAEEHDRVKHDISQSR